jgi:DNA-binding NarL/FixJ family response regulator
MPRQEQERREDRCRHPVQVMVVDDHRAVREGVTSILAGHPDVEVLGQAAGPLEALAKATALPPAVILLDIRLPAAASLEVCRAIRKRIPGCKVIMMTSFEDEDYLFKALQAGASGYLQKTASPEEIVAAIVAAAEGRRSLDGPMLDRLVARYTNLARKLELGDSTTGQVDTGSTDECVNR